MIYTDPASAFIDLLRRVNSSPNHIAPRSLHTRELVGVGFSIERPQERFVVTPHRLNNPVAMVAETVWVLAGRNDIQFLTHYLPRASDFSDDGSTWRAGYGSRLRDWNGVDQVAECLKILKTDQESRRAVMSIFDPGRDFTESKDIPCNNWLHWLVRDSSLLLSVGVRSNDLMWGFSGINAFEWSVLQEILASWLGVNVGKQSWLIGSLHLYERHWQRADRILAAASPHPTVYSKVTRKAAFSTPENEFRTLLAEWFELEQTIRNSPATVTDRDILALTDPLFQAFLFLIRAHWLATGGAHIEQTLASMSPISGTDVAIAGENFFRRKANVPDWNPPEIDITTGQRLLTYIETLHREKDSTYGNSWKRRGEQISICANIARKVDRLENIAAGAPVANETLLDTVVDAFVYALKYQTFLLDRDESIRTSVLNDREIDSASEGPAGFEALLRRYQSWEGEVAALALSAPRIVSAFSAIEHAISDAESDGERFRLATKLADECFRLALSCWTD